MRSLMKAANTDAPGDPAEFLAEVAAGRDPRAIKSSLYRLVKEIDEEGLDTPTPEDWDIIRFLVLESGLYKKQPVSLDVSMAAANKLIDFLHPKQKSVELDGKIDATVKVLPALSEEEIRAFNKVFNRQY